MVESVKSAGVGPPRLSASYCPIRMHKAPSDCRFHIMKCTPVGVDIAKHLIQKRSHISEKFSTS